MNSERKWLPVALYAERTQIVTLLCQSSASPESMTKMDIGGLLSQRVKSDKHSMNTPKEQRGSCSIDSPDRCAAKELSSGSSFSRYMDVVAFAGVTSASDK